MPGTKVPVFDELQLLSPGALATFAVKVVAPTSRDVEALDTAAVIRSRTDNYYISFARNWPAGCN
jgi:hypothetical protein